jgi:hypothetical protein
MTAWPQTPDLDAQRAAMKKLAFLSGRWAGEARILRGAGESVEVEQTEEAQYKLEGLVLMIEGVGKKKLGGEPILQALGMLSYDDESRTYRLRSFNDGRFLETDVKLADHGEGISWGFMLGEIHTHSELRINEKGEWTELHEITIGSQPAKKFMEVRVRRSSL